MHSALVKLPQPLASEQTLLARKVPQLSAMLGAAAEHRLALAQNRASLSQPQTSGVPLPPQTVEAGQVAEQSTVREVPQLSLSGPTLAPQLPAEDNELSAARQN